MVVVFGFFFFFGRVTQIKTHAWDNTSVVLVGNKCDLEDMRTVEREDGSKLAETIGMTSEVEIRSKTEPWLGFLTQIVNISLSLSLSLSFLHSIPRALVTMTTVQL